MASPVPMGPFSHIYSRAFGIRRARFSHVRGTHCYAVVRGRPELNAKLTVSRLIRESTRFNYIQLNSPVSSPHCRTVPCRNSSLESYSSRQACSTLTSLQVLPPACVPAITLASSFSRHGCVTQGDRSSLSPSPAPPLRAIRQDTASTRI